MYGDDQPVIVAFDIENHAIRTDNAGIRIRFYDIRGIFPVGLLNFVKPRFQS